MCYFPFNFVTLGTVLNVFLTGYELMPLVHMSVGVYTYPSDLQYCHFGG